MVSSSKGVEEEERIVNGGVGTMMSVYCDTEMNLLDRKMAAFTKYNVEDQAVLGEYAERLQMLALCVTGNGKFLGELVSHGTAFLGVGGGDGEKEMGKKLVDLDNEMVKAEAEELRELLGLCVREWSEIGRQARERLYTPLLEAVEEAYVEGVRAVGELGRADFRVLVPGAGAGRLAWELAKKGFAVEGSEGSACRLLAANYFLNHASIGHSWEIFPFIHSHGNVRSGKGQVKGVMVPDVSASDVYQGTEAEFGMRTGAFVDVYEDADAEIADAVVSCLEFDLGEAIVQVVRRVSTLLRSGGIWAFLGPRPAVISEDTLSVQLSKTEFFDVLKKAGFRVIKEQTVLCPLQVGDDSLRNRCVNATLLVAMKVRAMK